MLVLYSRAIWAGVVSGEGMSSQVTHLFIKPARGQPMQPRRSVEAVAGKGIAGDASFGTTRRQVLVIDAETLAGFQLLPGNVRENIVTRGLTLRGVPAGSRLQIADVVLEITGDCTPCDYMEELRPGLRREIAGQRGLLARVVEGGTISVGAGVRLETQPVPAGRNHG